MKILDSGLINVIVTLIIIGGFTYVFIFEGKVEKIPFLKNKKLKTSKKSSNTTEGNQKAIKRGFVQDFLNFDDIIAFGEDSEYGIVAKKGKKEFICMMEVSGINYNLLSISEIFALEDNFTTFLNGLDYKIQINVISQKLDADDYIKRYKQRVEDIRNNIDRINKKLQGAIKNENQQDIDNLKWKLDRLSRQYEYGCNFVNFVIEKISGKNMIDKKYILSISYLHDSMKFNEELSYEEIIQNAYFNLITKGNSIKSILKGSNLDTKILNCVEIAEVIYSSYNKEDSENIKLRNSLKSKFSSLFVTSKPVEIKAAEYKLALLKEEGDEFNREII